MASKRNQGPLRAVHARSTHARSPTSGAAQLPTITCRVRLRSHALNERPEFADRGSCRVDGPAELSARVRPAPELGHDGRGGRIAGPGCAISSPEVGGLPRSRCKRRKASKTVASVHSPTSWLSPRPAARRPAFQDPKWARSARQRICSTLATSRRSPAVCSAPHHQGPCGASHGAQTGGSSASSNTPRSARRRTPHRRRLSTARAPDTRRAQLKRLHHPPEAAVRGVQEARMQNRWRAGGTQSQSGRTAQPGRSRLSDLAPAPWQDTRHPARSEVGRVGAIGSRSTQSMTLCTSSDLDSIGDVRHLLNIDALTASARSDQHLLDQGADEIALLVERQAVPRTRRGGEVALRVCRLQRYVALLCGVPHLTQLPQPSDRRRFDLEPRERDDRFVQRRLSALHVESCQLDGVALITRTLGSSLAAVPDEKVISCRTRRNGVYPGRSRPATGQTV